jgi:uncharacterized protein YyaL (SSP411 family)
LSVVALLAMGCQNQERTDLHEGRRPNRLVHEKSPYLLQHAYNPVDWYPWGDEAFARAKREDKPIFLSVGYSTCHWCHVMERESFENDTLAESLNQWFVPIKVDREERPDVDRVYMNAAFALTGGGGWPLSVFLTPEGKPFYAGTYFPPSSHGGRPGFLELLRGIHEAWTERRPQVSASADELASAIERAVRVEPDSSSVALAEVRHLGYEHLESMYDARWGGFGSAPKFPQPSYFYFLFREWAASGNARARDMALGTLRHMARGGMHDQLGGGFHRYSTDAEWRVPHFEKMLYDQAQLARAYVEAFQITGDRAYADVARDVLDYVGRDLTSPEGGFYSAEDADSPDGEGRSEEGAFYVWTAAEVESVLGRERAKAFLAHYGITPEGNFEHGKNVLHATTELAETARKLGVPVDKLSADLAEDRRRLLAAREVRPRPHKDDKVLAAWNGLMISAYARAATALDSPADLEHARRAADFAWSKLWDESSRTLRRRYRDGEAAIAGELSDYAFLAQGELDLFEAGFDERHLERALTLTDRQIELFWDESQGGFFDTAAGSDPHLFARGKEAHDGAEPSGNSVAVANLARLARLADRDDLEEKARRTLDLFASHASRSPLALTQMWGAAYLLDGRPVQIVVAGRPDAPDTRAMLAVARRTFAPGRVVLLADGGDGQRRLATRLPYLAGVKAVDGRATAYMCENFTCGLPTTSAEELTRRLQQATAHAAIP